MPPLERHSMAGRNPSRHNATLVGAALLLACIFPAPAPADIGWGDSPAIIVDPSSEALGWGDSPVIIVDPSRPALGSGDSGTFSVNNNAGNDDNAVWVNLAYTTLDPYQLCPTASVLLLTLSVAGLMATRRSRA